MKPRATIALCALCCAVPLLRGQHSVQTPGNGNGLEELKAALDRPGPEGAEGRQAAIENLLGRLELKAHALLQERLRAPAHEDLPREILTALARRVRNSSDRVFSIGDENKEQRQQVVRSYVPSLVTFWLEAPPGSDAKVVGTREQWRELARACTSKMPLFEFDEGLRALLLLPTQEETMQVAALQCAADCREMFYAGLLADQLGHRSPRVQAAARAALKRLCFLPEEFTSIEQFQQWKQKNGDKRYYDLAEEAARAAESLVLRMQAEFHAQLVQKNVDVVAAMAENRAAINWTAVQALALTDEPPGTTDACLERLRQRLQDELHADKNAPTAERHAFHKSLLEAWNKTPVEQVRRRALLLETAAYLLRPGEAELAVEMEKLLVQQLAAAEPVLVLAATRGLRRFPTVSSRTALVRTARAAVDDPRGPDLGLLRAILRTLGRPGNTAPAETDADKPEWIGLIRRLLQGDAFKELRSDAMAMAVVPDARGERVPEVFDALLALAEDQSQGGEVRQRSLIHLKDFLKKEERADTFVRELAGLLADSDQEIRRFAANELARLRLDHLEASRRVWIQVVQQAARERLRVETNPDVLRALIDCIKVGARKPGSPDLAIGSIKLVLEEIGFPVPAEQQFRVRPLLAALAEIAGEPMTDPGLQGLPWLSAGEVLWRHEERRHLRHVLESQHASALSSEVASGDQSKADRARQAMWLLLRTAALRPATESWSAPEAKQEATDVRAAFAALDGVNVELDAPALRILRLQVLAALGAHADVVAFGTRWLAGDDKPKGGVGLSPEQKDTVRLWMAEARLFQGQLDKAEALLRERDPVRSGEAPTLLVVDRLARAHLDAGAPDKALPWLDQVLKATGESDPRFRARLLAWAQTYVHVNPGSRQDVIAQLERSVTLFRSADCPPDLKEAFDRLRALH